MAGEEDGLGDERHGLRERNDVVESTRWEGCVWSSWCSRNVLDELGELGCLEGGTQKLTSY